MKKLVWLAALVALFYGHSRWMLSESRALRWIESHEQAVFEQKEGVCNDFSWDTEVSVRAVHAKGEWQLDGDRAYVCDYIKAANATVRLLKPQIHTDTELVSLQRSGFPWMSAEVKAAFAFARVESRVLADPASTLATVMSAVSFWTSSARLAIAICRP